MPLSVFSERRIFPPKKFFLIVWISTFLLAVLGVIVAPKPSVPLVVWIVIAAIAIRQIWTTRWVEIDAEGLRSRNVLRQGRAVRWENVAEVKEQAFALRREKSFRVVRIVGRARAGEKQDVVQFDTDTVGFDTLRDLVFEAAAVMASERDNTNPITIQRANGLRGRQSGGDDIPPLS